MLIQPLPCVTGFVEDLNHTLSALQRLGESVGLPTVVVVYGPDGHRDDRYPELGSVRAAQFTGVQTKPSALDVLLGENCLAVATPSQRVGRLLKYYDVTSGVPVIDDTEKQRSKRTRKTADAHKIKDEKTGGYFNGQELIFMVLVTDRLTLPVGFRWYRPDPALKAWHKQNERLKRQGIARHHRPEKPAPNSDYPTQQALAQTMVEEFTGRFPELSIKATLADALYGTGEFMDGVGVATANAQVVSQLRAAPSWSTAVAGKWRCRLTSPVAWLELRKSTFRGF